MTKDLVTKELLPREMLTKELLPRERLRREFFEQSPESLQPQHRLQWYWQVEHFQVELTMQLVEGLRFALMIVSVNILAWLAYTSIII